MTAGSQNARNFAVAGGDIEVMKNAPPENEIEGIVGESKIFCIHRVEVAVYVALLFSSLLSGPDSLIGYIDTGVLCRLLRDFVEDQRTTAIGTAIFQYTRVFYKTLHKCVLRTHRTSNSQVPFIEMFAKVLTAFCEAPVMKF